MGKIFIVCHGGKEEDKMLGMSRLKSPLFPELGTVGLLLN